MFAELLRSKLAGICEVNDEQAERLRQHYELLVKWNRVISLTSIQSLEQVIERHYCESIFLACHLPDDPISVADVGSGAGFPGIPLAVLRPRATVTLIESHQRKGVFLREASRELANVRVLAKRAEEVAESYDWVVSRAVKYTQISAALKRLGRNAELLTGELHVSQLTGFCWQDPMRLPWGKHRFLWIGKHCFT